MKTATRRSSRKRAPEFAAPRVTVRIDFDAEARLGPGKIALLEMIERERSISAAARALGMSYRRAWLLADDVNRMFREPVVLTYPGRAQSGGAALTDFGRKLVSAYRTIERRATRTMSAAVARMSEALRDPKSARRATSKPARSQSNRRARR